METPQGTTKVTAAKVRKRLKRIHVQPTDNGGFVVTHHHHPEHGGTPAPARHAFTSFRKMHSHVAKTMQEHR